MLRRKGLATLTACAAAAVAAMAYTGQVRAADVDSSGAVAMSAGTTSADSSNTLGLLPSAPDSTAATPTAGASAVSDQPVYLQNASSTAAPVKPLQSILNYTPIGKPLGNLGVGVSGFVEGSWTYASPPDERYITGRSFDFEPQSILLDAVDLDVTRTVDTTANKFDIGFNVEQLYGADGALIHSNGLTTYSPTRILGAYTTSGGRHPKNQYDLTQAYLSFAIPLGNGIGVTVGKFDTLLGYEVIDGPLNPFYSHSFLFTQLPFTNTGVLISYNITPNITATGGFTRGWDQALKDTNGSLDATGQLKISAGKWTFFANAESGDEQPTPPPGFAGEDGWRTVIDLIATYAYSDNLTLTVNGDYGFQASSPAASGGTSQWYGVAGYAGFKISDLITVNFRGEWFDDQDGGAPASFNPGVANQYLEASLNAKITPFPSNDLLSNLNFRPEVRYDYAEHPTWNGNTLRNQVTVGVEGYFTF
jgi:hypothetical protein